MWPIFHFSSATRSESPTIPTCRIICESSIRCRESSGAGSRCHGKAALLRDQLLFDRQTQPDRNHSERNAGRSGTAARSCAACGVRKEDDVLELYHSINSVCAQKVRIALKEKGQEAKSHI